jgi:hypothetical protein
MHEARPQDSCAPSMPHLDRPRERAQHVGHVLLTQLRQLQLKLPKHEAPTEPDLLAHARVQ